ncbi:hypothetical protein [Lacinutrix sp. Hel_I_90]|uniref:hypothetical protein n=1 Tax=Lacinutrix sp. Hel_I_90 TaxID=1249999 RepID=UPI0005C89F20|nr:hypothetical protein [Lacinutrix sp. Hel_I_90]
MKKITILLFTFLFSYTINGQIEQATTNVNQLSLIPNEHAVLHTNTELVLVGEYLYYKLFIFSEDKPSSISQIAYVELIDADNTAIIKHELQIKNNSANNNIFIPSELKTGNYKLLAYTNWSKNDTKRGLFVKDICVVNPFSSTFQSLKDSSKTINIIKANALNQKHSKNDNVTIKTSKKNYSTREVLTLDILGNDKIKNGNYSLSIKKLDSIIIENNSSQAYAFPDTSSSIYIPEMRGKLIVGKLSNLKDKSDVNNKSVALSIANKNYIFKIAQTNASGQFFFNIDSVLNDQEITLQVVEENNADFKIELSNTETTNYKDLVFKDLDIDSGLKHALEQRNIKTQIENAYFENKPVNIREKVKSDPFFYNTGRTYILDDYTRFKTVRETFIELIPEAGLRKEADNYRIIVYEDDAARENNTLTNLKPLIVVDGLMIQDNNDLVNYNPKKIESITIVKGNYIYGANLFQGVIAVSTFLQDFKTSSKGDFIINTNLNIYKNTKIYYQPDYEDTDKLKYVPDYRQQLLWDPNVTLASNSETFKTYTSDDKGTYEIIFEGYTKDGEYINANQYFEVD